jgi:hypothetical protein
MAEMSLNILRDGLGAFWTGRALIYWTELFRKQRANIGLGAVAVAHVGELGRALFPDDAVALNDVIAPASVPGASHLPDIAALLASQWTSLSVWKSFENGEFGAKCVQST